MPCSHKQRKYEVKTQTKLKKILPCWIRQLGRFIEDLENMRHVHLYQTKGTVNVQSDSEFIKCFISKFDLLSELDWTGLEVLKHCRLLYHTKLRNVQYTANSEVFARFCFRETSRNLNPREMAKSICRLLMQVKHAPVGIFKCHKCVFKI